MSRARQRDESIEMNKTVCPVCKKHKPKGSIVCMKCVLPGVVPDYISPEQYYQFVLVESRKYYKKKKNES